MNVFYIKYDGRVFRILDSYPCSICILEAYTIHGRSTKRDVLQLILQGRKLEDMNVNMDRLIAKWILFNIRYMVLSKLLSRFDYLKPEIDNLRHLNIQNQAA